MKKYTLRNYSSKEVVAENLTDEEVQNFIGEEATRENYGLYRVIQDPTGYIYDTGRRLLQALEL
ncbi:hypothetical protein EOM81_01635 [bacterium]|nr:hypothetical protein [bacterium]